MVSFHGVNVTMPVSVSGSNPADFDDILFFLSSKLSLPDVYLYYTAILQILILVCVAFSTLVAMDRITHVLAYFWYKAYFYLTATKPEDKFLFRQIPTYYLQVTSNAPIKLDSITVPYRCMQQNCAATQYENDCQMEQSSA